MSQGVYVENHLTLSDRNATAVDDEDMASIVILKRKHMSCLIST